MVWLRVIGRLVLVLGLASFWGCSGAESSESEDIAAPGPAGEDATPGSDLGEGDSSFVEDVLASEPDVLVDEDIDSQLDIPEAAGDAVDVSESEDVGTESQDSSDGSDANEELDLGTESSDAGSPVFVCTTDLSCVDAGFDVESCEKAVCRNGLCAAEAVVCEDEYFCTQDSCNEETGECEFLAEALQGTPCEDGNICTQGDFCSDGACMAGTMKDCDDGNLCTYDECFWVTGQCVYDGGPANGIVCNDNDLCTEFDRCEGGSCAGEPKCTDGNPCTEESCDAANGSCGASLVVNGLDCSDGDPCTIGDVCESGECLPGNALNCDDFDTCTDDVCDPFTGECAHLVAANLGQVCDDGSVCTENDVCTSKGCVGSATPGLGQECVLGEGCLNPHVIDELPFTFAGDTTGYANDFDTTGCSGSYSVKGGGSPDIIFTYVAESSAEYRFELMKVQGGLDTVLYIASGCPGEASTVCHEQDDSYGSGGEDIKKVLAKGEIVYIVVDGYGLYSSQEGTFILKVTKTEEVELACDDGLDNDSDGMGDCDDEDCDAVLACAPQGDLCGDPLALSLDQSVVLNNETFHNLYSRSDCDGGDGGSGAPDVVHSFTAPKLGDYTFKVVGANTEFDSILFVNKDCEPTINGCVGVSEEAKGVDETITHGMKEGETVFIFVDGYFSFSDGSFELVVDADFKEEQCTDGLDDDSDGLIDCEDDDCAESYNCSAVGDACETAIVVDGAFPIELEASTALEGIFNKYSGSSCVETWPADNSPELVYSFLAPAQGWYRFELPFGSSSFDARLYLASSCPAAPETCIGAEDLGANGGEKVLAELDSGEQVFIWVDGSTNVTSQGSFKLVVDRVESQCADQSDDDADGLTDCDDPDCASQLECALQGVRCEFPHTLSEQSTFSGTTTGNQDIYSEANCQDGQSGKSAPDVAHFFEAEESGKYTFSLNAGENSFDSMLWVSSSCPPAPEFCFGLADEPVSLVANASQESMDILLNKGESVFVFVDGGAPGESGDYDLSVSHVAAETECENGLDDDQDGLPDCLDADCGFSLICAGASEDCSTALSLGASLPLTISGDSTSYASDFEPKDCKGATGGDAPDLVYAFTSPAAGTYEFSLTKSGTSFDSVLYVAESCPPTTLSCIEKKDGVGNGGESIEATLELGETVYVYIDGYKTYSGSFELVVSQK